MKYEAKFTLREEGHDVTFKAASHSGDMKAENLQRLIKQQIN